MLKRMCVCVWLNHWAAHLKHSTCTSIILQHQSTRLHFLLTFLCRDLFSIIFYRIRGQHCLAGSYSKCMFEFQKRQTIFQRARTTSQPYQQRAVNDPTINKSEAYPRTPLPDSRAAGSLLINLLFSSIIFQLDKHVLNVEATENVKEAFLSPSFLR